MPSWRVRPRPPQTPRRVLYLMTVRNQRASNKQDRRNSADHITCCIEKRPFPFVLGLGLSTGRGYRSHGTPSFPCAHDRASSLGHLDDCVDHVGPIDIHGLKYMKLNPHTTLHSIVWVFGSLSRTGNECLPNTNGIP